VADAAAQPVGTGEFEMQTERPQTLAAVSYTSTAQGTSNQATKKSYFQHLQTSEAELVKDLLMNPPDKSSVPT